MPTVRGVMCASICAMSMLKVGKSMSQKTARPPRYSTALAVATQVKAGTITSSPGPTPMIVMATCNAVVQFETATACFTPVNSANFRSNSATYGP